MKIGSFEDRISVEFRRQFGKVWVKMLDQFNIESGSNTERRFVKGLERGLMRSLIEVDDWLSPKDVMQIYGDFLYRVPYSILENHLKERREETESCLKGCV